MFAAIDIGSNAVRLAFLSVGAKEAAVIRTPIRLGDDCFSQSKISNENIDKLASALVSYKGILEDNEIKHYRAVATSALRESNNANDVVQIVKEKSGIEIQLIDGIEEARLIQKAVCRELNLGKTPHLIMDIGGGSVEFAAVEENNIVDLVSLKMGTVRMLNEFMDSPQEKLNKRYQKHSYKTFSELKSISKFVEKNRNDLCFIGTGGNFRRIRKLNRDMFNKTNSAPVKFSDLYAINDTLHSMTFKERIETLGLRKDRADVILPASCMVLAAMEVFELKQVTVPQSGLKNGVMFELMDQQGVEAT